VKRRPPVRKKLKRRKKQQRARCCGGFWTLPFCLCRPDCPVARHLASAIAAYADVAETARDLDPDDVAELTQELWEAMQGGPAETAARAALRWFRDKQGASRRKAARSAAAPKQGEGEGV
jgi:hypothetical protein